MGRGSFMADIPFRDGMVKVSPVPNWMLGRSMEIGLDGAIGARALADEAMVSRSEWYRRMASEGLDRPASVQRRLLLERAAHRLTHEAESVSQLGLQAGYENTSGFTRAFRKAYGLSPREYRRCRPTDWRIPPLCGLHYGVGTSDLAPRQGELTLKLIELWINDHARAAEKMARALHAGPDIRNEKANFRNPFPWEPIDSVTVGELANRVTGFGEPWIHLLDGQPPSSNEGTLDSRLLQIEENAKRFSELVLRFESEGSWDMTFVDHECEPPVVFSYGSVVLHVLVYTDHARVELEMELRQRGILDDWIPPA
ncbi:MAG: AraC family transcriptional regulator [Alphaproteobacteria bacterium]|nr:MAG: AraC family transcriptional regulator [Alphaproteobacteria bacterium]